MRVTNHTILDSNRLLPADPTTRAIAVELLELVQDLPIIAPHGHVDPTILVQNKPFANPAELFLYYDHYVFRLLYANGLGIDFLKRGGTEEEARSAWKLLCSNWHLLAGTSSGYWLVEEFSTLFGIQELPSQENADELFDRISDCLTQPEFLPRALFERFNIAVLATTDDPIDDLAAHRTLAADPTFQGLVAPTFRPDKYLDPRAINWKANVAELLATAGLTGLNYQNFVQALRIRRDYFIASGAFSVDHGVEEPHTADLTENQASQLFEAAVNGTIDAAGAREFAGHMLTVSAGMSCEDGLVMTLHAGVVRNHSSQTKALIGADTGHDIPVKCEFTNNLHALLERHGLDSRLHLILFSLDESNWSREIAPLAGFYPSVFIGSPWWFLDAPDAIGRFRSATVESAGFYKGSGFIDDTRAFLSIPARHDMARRCDAGFLAGQVVAGRITLQQARTIMVDTVTTIPRKAFKL
jgi:glucuronate isomerase